MTTAIRRRMRRGRTVTRAAIVASVMLGTIACSGGARRAPLAPTPSSAPTVAATSTPVYGSPIAPPPSPLPVERGTADASDGIGIYPTLLSFPDTLRGRDYYGTVGVINGGPHDRTYRFETEGDAAAWLSFVTTSDRGATLREISVPAHGSVQVMVRADVPATVPNGQYTGLVRVITTGATNAGSSTRPGVGVNLGGEVSVALAVTGTERVEGQFISASASDVESGYPLRIQSSLVNTGNVQVNPTFDIAFNGFYGNPVDHLVTSDQTLTPNEHKQLIIEWPTSGKPLGLLVARIRVAYGSLDLGTKEVRFNIVPPGTFTRRAELASVRLVNRPQPGELAKITALFKNTGQIQTTGKFIGELYVGDRLIESLQSPEQLLLPGGSGDLEVLAHVVDKGTYTVKGKINYEGRETDVQQVSFKVGSGGGIPGWIVFVASGVTAAVIAGGGLWFARRRFRPRRSAW
ncbi:MAG TPA: hypothetical protein VEZ14_13305 [Dehalococcoidia bacterium]|nr:hypothetical protein [Dehalococcoidia bacterium]